ncbi:DUF445 domain-containing protein [Sphingomonas astaxanthinifaciens]|uniref:Membrane protein n=1 Tax=Sphingomonas astaxanthinifaciens DSM 22298 TaxID=1123267 RepID=A0ABQ5Z8G5_9SPHN|nr:DUF445 domain-containing protein [Sphingomonas astaxanthinifaciens]GLR47148.1 membrane protein [Sphingomonas astaxanthinifaciens DSM 22298]
MTRSGPLSRFNPAQPGAAGMKLVATGLLVLMAALFLVTRALEPRHPWLGFVKAFAEAAMVGGLADWFAVTALFRHPLGLPIPHTAIIPRNKDRIGATLANFIRDNFLVARVVARRMRGIDVAGAAGRFLQTPSGEGTRIRRGASRLIADLFESLDDERLGGIFKGAIAQRLARTEVSPLLGAALASAIEDNRHVPMLEAAIGALARALDANEPLIREMVKRRASWVLRLAALDEKLADAIVEGLRKLTVEVSTDPEHPMRAKMVEALTRLADDLQHKPETRARVEAWKEELLANRSVAQWLDRLWQKGRASIIAAARNPDAALAGRMGEVLRSAGATLEGDPRIRAAVNQFVRRAVAGMAASYGGSIVGLVSETIRGWDARTVTERLESAVGRDLQYIRINGTIVGGLVGLALHVLDTL